MIPAFYQHQGDNGGGGPTSSTPSANARAPTMDGAHTYRIWMRLSVGDAHGRRHPSLRQCQCLAVRRAGGANPGVGTALTAAGTWLNTADDTVIPNLIAAGSLNNYLSQQKVDPGNLGLFGLLDTQYQTLPNGQVQVWTIAGWRTSRPIRSNCTSS